jgi:hypothetical protein
MALGGNIYQLMLAFLIGVAFAMRTGRSRAEAAVFGARTSFILGGFDAFLRKALVSSHLGHVRAGDLGLKRVARRMACLRDCQPAASELVRSRASADLVYALLPSLTVPGISCTASQVHNFCQKPARPTMLCSSSTFGLLAGRTEDRGRRLPYLCNDCPHDPHQHNAEDCCHKPRAIEGAQQHQNAEQSR